MDTEDILSREEWLCTVQKRIGTTDCEIIEMSRGKLDADIGGFMGDHQKVEVVVLDRRKDVPVSSKLAFFVKKIPYDHQEHTDMVLASGSFGKETLLYSTVFSRLPECEPRWSPQCFFTRSDVLVFEDLNKEGFKVLGRHTYLDYSHCSIVLETLARFHAASIIFEENETVISNKPCRLNELYPEAMYENMYVEDKSCKYRLFFDASVLTVASMVKLLSKYENKKELQEDIGMKVTKQLHKMLAFVKPSKEYRNVMCHADLWTTNVLFKYESEKPVEARMVDFQLVRYTPPAMDIVSFMHMTTTQEFRAGNSEKLLSVYYDSLGKELNRHGLNVEKILPWSELKESVEVYRSFGVSIAVMYHHINTMPMEVLGEVLDVPDIYRQYVFENRFDRVELSFKTDQVYRDRITAEMEELVEYSLQYP